MDRRWVSAVALYGPKTGEVRNLLESVQATIARQLGGAFLPYTLEQIHGTLIGLNGVREPATGVLISQYYLEHRGARRVMDFERVLQILEVYPSELRNLLMRLALTGLFRAKWSAAVHEEWIGALLRRRPDLSSNASDHQRFSDGERSSELRERVSQTARFMDQ